MSESLDLPLWEWEKGDDWRYRAQETDLHLSVTAFSAMFVQESDARSLQACE